MNKKSAVGAEPADKQEAETDRAMRTIRYAPLLRCLTALTGLFIVKSAVQISATYTGYFPPDFETRFLTGRQTYFFDGYHIGFYAHILAGPPTLLLGLILLHRPTRQRFPRLHRRLGKVQVALILLLLTPGGLVMAQYAESGAVAGAAFGCLAVATAGTCLLGWRTAAQRQLAAHQRWMLRNYTLLCSAVVLRILGGLATVAQVSADWSYPLSAWLCWLGPLTVCEIMMHRTRRGQGGALNRAPIPSVRKR